jgi:tetratricopeptide (TPR) repeat protein
MFLMTSAVADDSDIDNVAACNGKAASPDLQIEGCTALTKSADNPKVLAIIYNNRGNAYVAKGQYDLAIQDYGEALKADPQYAKAFNNRDVAHQKKPHMISRFRTSMRRSNSIQITPTLLPIVPRLTAKRATT